MLFIGLERRSVAAEEEDGGCDELVIFGKGRRWAHRVFDEFILSCDDEEV